MDEIIKYPNSILKQKCLPVDMVGDGEKNILGKMLKIMHANNGIGLAASQLGIDKQLAVVDIGDGKVIKLINPTLMEARGNETMEEGCLSIPNVYINIKRAKEIKIKMLNENGQEAFLEANGLLARAILHEIDHLKGRLIIDYINPIKRFIVLRSKQ